MTELLGLDNLLSELVLVLGLAMLAGNGFALIQHRRGQRPVKAEGEMRRGRVIWLLSVGVLLTFWGAVSLWAS